MSEYITLDEFAARYKVKPNTIKRKYKSIHEIEKNQSEYRVLEGSRYPFNIGSYKIESKDEKKYALLKAISRYRYIDEKMLGLPEKSFRKMLDDLEKMGLIEQNNLGNYFGANEYDCTDKGTKIIEKKKNKVIEELVRLSGMVVGGVIAGYKIVKNGCLS